MDADGFLTPVVESPKSQQAKSLGEKNQPIKLDLIF